MFFKTDLYCHHISQQYFQNDQTRFAVKTSAKTHTLFLKMKKTKQNTSLCWILLTDFHSALRIFVILWQKIKITFELLVRNHPELFAQSFFFSSHNWHALSPLCQHFCDSPLHAVRYLRTEKWQHTSGLELWSIEKGWQRVAYLSWSKTQHVTEQWCWFGYEQFHGSSSRIYYCSIYNQVW